MKTNRKLTLLLIAFFFVLSTYGQKKEIDSIKAIFNQNPDYISALSLSQHYFGKQIDSAAFYAEKAVDLLPESASDSLKGRVIGHYGQCLVENHEYGKADVFLKQALEIQQSLIQLDLKGLSQTYNTLGNLYFYQKNPLKTAQYYQKSLLLDEQIGDTSKLAKSYASLASVYRAMRSDTLALESFKKALFLTQFERDSLSQLKTLINLASFFGSSGNRLFNLDSAIFYGRKAVSIAEQMGSEYGAARAKQVLASPLIRKGYDNPPLLLEGLDIATYCRKFFSRSNYRFGYLDARLNEGFAYEALEQPDSAIQIANELKSIGFATYECDRLLSEAYQQKGDFQIALNYFISYQKTLDSIRLSGERARLGQFQLGFENEKITSEKLEAEKKTAVFKAESEQNRLLFMGAIVLAILIVIIFLILISQRKEKEKADLAIIELQSSQKQLALEKQYRDSELKALKAQMNPHFIFNVLNSIQEYIVMNDKVQASDYLSMFSQLIRSYLDQSGQKSISIQEEVETMDRYLKLEALRFGAEFYAEIKVDNSIDKESVRIPPMIIQPFVENAIKHGLFNKSGVKQISINLKAIEAQIIECTITDNGIGRAAAGKIKASKPILHESFALGATQSRVELYNQQSGREISIDIKDLIDENGHPSGTEVKVTIPIQS